MSEMKSTLDGIIDGTLQMKMLIILRHRSISKMKHRGGKGVIIIAIIVITSYTVF